MDNILVVEDEQYIREFVVVNLKRNDFCTFEAESGEKALIILSTNNIDLRFHNAFLFLHIIIRLQF